MPGPILDPSARGYARPDLFVTTEWLAAHLDDPAVRIVDTDRPDSYQRAHISGAAGVVDHYYKGGPDRVHVQSPAEFAATMASLGISDGTTVVAYDSDLHFAPRLFWALNYYGHAAVKLLDGGFPKWFAEGRPLARSPYRGPAGSFHPRVQGDWIATKDDVVACISRPDTVLLDVRSDQEWTGENARGTKRGGRLPGAVHLEWTNFVQQGEIPVLKPADEIDAMLGQLGITRDKNVVTY